MPCAMISWTWMATSTYMRYLDMSIPGPSSLMTLFSHVCVWFWEVRGFFLGGCVNCRQLMEAGEKTRRCCWRSMILSGWNSVTFSLLMYVSLLCLSLEMYQIWRPSFLCFCLGLFLSLFFPFLLYSSLAVPPVGFLLCLHIMGVLSEDWLTDSWTTLKQASVRLTDKMQTFASKNKAAQIKLGTR